VEAQQGFDLSLLWLWPILLLQVMLETFAGHAVQLKALRKRKPAPADWSLHVENLRIAEWASRAYIAGHARRLLAGEAIDLADARVPIAPPDWRRPEPRSMSELILRFEALTRLHANPMRAIERYVRRLAATVRAADPRQAGVSSAPPAEGAPCVLPAAPITPSWTLGIRAPP
jgi:hypothetical protein